MFTNHPDLRVYFKGAENYDAAKVQGSERFAKQGQRILLGNYILVNTYDDPVAFKAYARETVDRHRQYKMAPELWLVSAKFISAECFIYNFLLGFLHCIRQLLE